MNEVLKEWEWINEDVSDFVNSGLDLRNLVKKINNLLQKYPQYAKIVLIADEKNMYELYGYYNLEKYIEHYPEKK